MNHQNNDDKNIFYCEKCKYSTCKKCNYKKHLNTSKHINTHKHINAHKHINKTIKNPIKIFECVQCKNIYRCRSTLWRHSKQCGVKQKHEIPSNDKIIKNTEPINEPINEPIKLTHEMFYELLKQNNELLKQLKECLIDR